MVNNLRSFERSELERNNKGWTGKMILNDSALINFLSSQITHIYQNLNPAFRIYQ